MRNDHGRKLPWSEEAEISVLGAMLIDSDAARDARDLVRADHFYKRQHETIFRALVGIVGRGELPDATLLADELESSGKLEAAGGMSYLGGLVNAVPTAANLEAYARILREKAALREAIRAARKTIEEAYAATSDDVKDVLDAAESRILSASQVLLNESSPGESAGDLVDRFLDRVEEAGQSPGGVTGLSTGFPDLDRRTRGLDPGSLTVVAGRPSMGKTALANDFTRHAVLQKGTPALLLSLEMPAETVVGRMLAQEEGLPFQKVVTGQIGDAERQRLKQAAARLRASPLHVESPSTLNLYELRTRARRLHRRQDGGLGLLIVDYLQLMDGPANVGNREQEVARISRGLKSIALELAVPVVALSQLSRAPEKRPGSNRPRLSDLRESGAIEQDADLVVFVYREEMYVDPSEARFSEVESQAELIIGKHRNGPTGTVEMWFRKAPISFESMANRSEEVPA